MFLRAEDEEDLIFILFKVKHLKNNIPYSLSKKSHIPINHLH